MNWLTFEKFLSNFDKKYGILNFLLIFPLFCEIWNGEC